MEYSQYATLFLTVFSLHDICLGAISDKYIPPSPNDVCPCDGQEKNIMLEMSTIRITKTEQLPPVLETKSLPPVTSYMTLPVVNETITVVETMEQFISLTELTPPPVTIYKPQPMLTILSPYSVVTTEIKEPVTKTKTQEVTKFVPAKPFLSTLIVTSTESLEPIMYFISFTPITNTETVPLAISFITSQITVTEALPPIIKTVRFGSVTTLRPRTVTVTPEPVTIHSAPHIDFKTVGITHTSIAQPVTKTREHIVIKTNTDCGGRSKDYNYEEPTNAFNFRTPTATFIHG